MKVNKHVVIVMFLFCIIFFSTALLLEFSNVLPKESHKDFYLNFSIGLFASSLLVLVPSIVQYTNEKRKYYVAMYRILNYLLYDTLKIISIMNEYSKNEDISKYFESIKLQYNDLISEYSLFTKFFRLSSRDKLIESVISETYKFMKLQSHLASYRISLMNESISMLEYKEAFDSITEVLIKEYKPDFENYRKMIDEDMKNIIKDKEFKKYY
ncbi:hypothetical protein CDO73_23840 [Saccharibacillus sp. O23]|uniref:hypothetical protein n=1 Tax=Saccharibacillus sp. O23 TaxID=2009338 RepID=UPI000B4E36C4|nr:hypothetical protein [Saccharibacillus sp. O23]OWR27276.1 hypothetical protein CDO73_23840 [Saccharibacillus sp. O23]